MEAQKSLEAPRTEGTKGPFVISHIVLFTPKDGLTENQYLLFAQQLRLTMGSVSSVRRATVGRRVDVNSGSPRSFGDTAYQFSAVVEFDGKHGLIEYISHPLHQELGRLFWEYCSATAILDVDSVDAKTGAVVDLLVREQN
jgi:hypothetical protein